MLFNSLDFAVFLPVVFLLYWYVFNRSLKLRNAYLIAASYFFYGWWDWRFLSLILFSTLVDYWVGRALDDEERPRRRTLLLWTSIVVNIGFLGYFKYYNFFLDNFIAAFSFLGMEMDARALNVVLPVGISFYTFQTLSYTIDIYRRKMDATRDFVAYAAYVSFFPQLVAGPIERATNLLPQFFEKHSFDYHKAVDGMRQILWGLFKKVVIADNCAHLADLAFADPGSQAGSTLLLGAFFFAIQIYGDFSGYSDIAIGTARLFGFNLMQNFAFPYFSRDIAEFWRRWHISLSTWFRDYLYIPLGGSRVGRWLNIRNIFIVFVVSGFWHGASWTFIVWGALNAAYYLPLLLADKNRDNLDIVARGRLLPSAGELGAMAVTFGLTTFGWIFFRAEDMSHAFSYIAGIASPSLLTFPTFESRGLTADLTVLWVVVFLLIEWLGRDREYAIETAGFGWPRSLRLGFYLALAAAIVLFGAHGQQFIYFQF